MDAQHTRQDGGNHHLQRNREPADKQSGGDTAGDGMSGRAPQRRIVKHSTEPSRYGTVIDHREAETVPNAGAIRKKAVEPAAIHVMPWMSGNVRSTGWCRQACPG